MRHILEILHFQMIKVMTEFIKQKWSDVEKMWKYHSFDVKNSPDIIIRGNQIKVIRGIFPWDALECKRDRYIDRNNNIWWVKWILSLF